MASGMVSKSRAPLVGAAGAAIVGEIQKEGRLPRAPAQWICIDSAKIRTSYGSRKVASVF